MRLHSLKLNGFRRIKSAEILFGDATFLIGSNNAGKSTIFKAIETLLSGAKQLPSTEYYSVVDADSGAIDFAERYRTTDCRAQIID